MGDFAIIGEGITDQVVIRNVLLGYFDDWEDEPVINFEQPLLDETSAHAEHAPGGWTLVITYLKERKYLQALQLNRYLVIHIDTDIVHDLGIRVPQPSDGQTVLGLVVQHLRGLVDKTVVAEHGDRLLFAIGVDSIECWLLPLVFDASAKAKRAKQTGCLAAVDHELRRRQATPLSVADSKDHTSYERVSRPFRKRKVLAEHASGNPGLTAFYTDLARVLPP